MHLHIAEYGWAKKRTFVLFLIMNQVVMSLSIPCSVICLQVFDRTGQLSVMTFGLGICEPCILFGSKALAKTQVHLVSIWLCLFHNYSLAILDCHGVCFRNERSAVVASGNSQTWKDRCPNPSLYSAGPTLFAPLTSPLLRASWPDGDGSGNHQCAFLGPFRKCPHRRFFFRNTYLKIFSRLTP